MINAVLNIYDTISERLVGMTGELLPLLARVVFASTLLMFFLRSARTKFGDGFLGLFMPSEGAYFQILPSRYEAVGFDSSALGLVDWLIVVAGMWGEILLPIMIVIGLWTRLAALGMMVFIIVMSIVDVAFHGVETGMFFDGLPTGLIFDQRLFWMLAMMILLTLGGGTLSVDKLLSRLRG